VIFKKTFHHEGNEVHKDNQKIFTSEHVESEN